MDVIGSLFTIVQTSIRDFEKMRLILSRNWYSMRRDPRINEDQVEYD